MSSDRKDVLAVVSYADYYAGLDLGNSAYIKKNAGNSIASTRFGLSYENQFSSNFKNSTTLFYYSSDFERIAAGAYEVSKNPNYGLRSVFSWKKDISLKWKNEITFGTEIQQSTSLISNYRFLGTDDSNPLDASIKVIGFFIQTISINRYNDFQIDIKSFFDERKKDPILQQVIIDRIKYLD